MNDRERDARRWAGIGRPNCSKCGKPASAEGFMTNPPSKVIWGCPICKVYDIPDVTTIQEDIDWLRAMPICAQADEQAHYDRIMDRLERAEKDAQFMQAIREDETKAIAALARWVSEGGLPLEYIGKYATVQEAVPAYIAALKEKLERAEHLIAAEGIEPST